jgi:acetaldehyde dehydrogenase
MVTCGGQVSIPLLSYFSSKMNINYAEIVTQIAANSAGIATRVNIDKYIDTTENAILKLTNIQKCKVILNLNPSKTTVMQTTIFIKGQVNKTFEDFDEKIKDIRLHIPNYSVTVYPTYMSDGVLMTSVSIIGCGDYISKYYGNLDVITCAAVRILKKIIQSCQDFPKPLDISPESGKSSE